MKYAPEFRDLAMTDKPETGPIPGIYQHFKGGFYEVLGIADEPETGRRYVVYQALGLMENRLAPDPENHFDPQVRVTGTANKGALSVCSIERFSDIVDGKEYQGGAQVPRFRLVSPAPRQ